MDTVSVRVSDLLNEFANSDFSTYSNSLKAVRRKRLEYGDKLEKQSEANTKALHLVNNVGKVARGASVGAIFLGVFVLPGFLDGINPETAISILPSIWNASLVTGSIGVLGHATATFSGKKLDEIRGGVGKEIASIGQELEKIEKKKKSAGMVAEGSEIDDFSKYTVRDFVRDGNVSKKLFSILLHSDVSVLDAVTVLYSGPEYFNYLYDTVEDAFKTKSAQNFYLNPAQVDKYDTILGNLINKATEVTAKKIQDMNERMEKSKYHRPDGQRAYSTPQKSSVAIKQGRIEAVPSNFPSKSVVKRESLGTPLALTTIVTRANDDNSLNRRAGRNQIVRNSGNSPFDFDNPLEKRSPSDIAIANIKAGRDFFDGIPTADDMRRSLPSDSDERLTNYENQALDNVMQGHDIIDGIPVVPEGVRGTK